jgi:hypothetical protein
LDRIAENFVVSFSPISVCLRPAISPVGGPKFKAPRKPALASQPIGKAIPIPNELGSETGSLSTGVTWLTNSTYPQLNSESLQLRPELPDVAIAFGR